MENQKDALVGYVETPKTEIRFSLSLQEIESLKRYMTDGKNGNPGRVYLTMRSGMSKAGKAYNMISVYDPNAPKDGATHKPAGNTYKGAEDLF
jgi:hypothetical protein